MATLSSHVLDTARGRPAGRVPVRLERADGAVLAEGATDADGRVRDLGGDLGTGTYRLVFDSSTHFAAGATSGFYPEVVVTFEIGDPTDHYHVPLLLAPHGYTTYRGS